MLDSELVRRLSASALDLLFPPRCPVCVVGRVSAPGACCACRERLKPAASVACPRCATRLGPHARVESCRDCPLPFVAFAVAAGPYAGLRGELIRRVKYGAETVLIRLLEEELAECVADWDAAGRVQLVVPVPPSPRRVERRRFHLAGRLAEGVGGRLRVPVVARALRRIGTPVAQASLPRTERRRAPRGTVDRAARWSAALRPRVDGRHILLVDDVLTTGGTACECARVLRRAGAKSVSLAVLARA